MIICVGLDPGDPLYDFFMRICEHFLLQENERRSFYFLISRTQLKITPHSIIKVDPSFITRLIVCDTRAALETQFNSIFILLLHKHIHKLILIDSLLIEYQQHLADLYAKLPDDHHFLPELKGY